MKAMKSASALAKKGSNMMQKGKDAIQRGKDAMQGTQQTPPNDATSGASDTDAMAQGGLSGMIPTYTGADKAREMDLDLQEQNNLMEREKIQLERRRVKAMERMAKSNLRLFMLAFLKDLSPYLVLVFIILFIIFLSKSGAIFRPVRKINEKRRVMFSRAQGRWQRFVRWIKSKIQWIINLITPGYKTILFLRMFMPFGGKATHVPRDRVMSGRCDNQRWIQIDGGGQPEIHIDGRRGHCFSAIRPEDIQWDLDVSKMPDFQELPESMRKDMQNRMSIVIPYDNESTIRDGNTFFVPRCDKAYFKNARDKQGRPVPAKLLEDMGTSCKLASYPFVKGSYGTVGMTKGDLIKKQKL